MAIAKRGIDYYPRDVGMMRDRKFNKPRQKYGYVVYVIYDALLEMIYSDKGYYILYNDSTKGEVVWELQDYCRGKYSVEESTICGVIEMLAACELFSGDRFKQGIITSRRIQEVYYRITVERKNVAVSDKIWLLSLDEMRRISSKSSILQGIENRMRVERTSGDNRSDFGDNRSNGSVNNGISNERKEKESKQNKSTVNESENKENKEACSDIYIDSDIKRAYRECFLNVLEVGGKDWNVICQWLREFDKELICRAFHITKERGKDFIGYTAGVLKRWQAEGIKDDVEYLFGEE